MTRYLTYFLLFIILSTAACKESGQSNTSTSENGAQQKLTIVCTTGMIADIVKNVAGDKANVQALMGPGVDPHYYKATQGDLKKINGADLIFYNGLKLEGKMQSVFDKLSKKKKIMAVAGGIPPNDLILIDEENHQIVDPHIWFDVALWTRAVNAVMDKMRLEDAANKELYAENGKKYLQQLKELHQKVQREMATIPDNQRILITSHDAFSYMGRAYNLEVDALQGISTVAEFGLKDITNLVNKIVERKIKSVFIESSVSKKSLEAVVEGCKNKGHEVVIGGTLYSDAMGEEGTPEGTYIGMVNHNLSTILNGLK